MIETVDVQAQLARLLSSSAFAESPRARRLLEHLVRETLDDNAGGLKEYAIGVEVFDRPDDFDPRNDSIVRVQAGRLRRQLDAYYAGPGQSDPLVLAIPKGHYKVEIRPRPVPPDEKSGSEGAREKRPGRIAAWSGVAAFLTVTIVWIGYDSLRQPGGAIEEQTLTAISAAIGEDDRFSAFELALELEAVAPEHPELVAIFEEVATSGRVVTFPPGATAAYRRIEDSGAEWHTVGVTPQEGVRLPDSVLRWRMTLEGHTPIEFINIGANVAAVLLETPTGEHQVFVPSYPLQRDSTGQILNEDIQLPEFLIGRYEVTNSEFMEFVDAGGYEDARYWEGMEFLIDDEVRTWDEAVAFFTDTTGRAGPSTWEIGAPPPGTDNYPVTGVSWYEAKAYANFRNQDLPTIYHWVAAAIPWFAPYMAPSANFSSSVVPVGVTGSVSRWGAMDMAGNVREWAENAHGEGARWIMGAGHTDPEYVFSGKYSIPADDRNPINGIRLVTYPDPVEEKYQAPFDEVIRDNRRLRPVSEEVFEVLREQFVDRGPPLEATSIRRVDHERYTWERLSLNSDVVGESLLLNTYRPVGGQPPYEPIVVFPSWHSLANTSSESMDRILDIALQVAINTNRALVWPIYWGTHERYQPERDVFSRRNLENGLMAEAMVHWYSDMKRTIDYLETLPDIDHQSVVYAGFSMGAAWPIPLLAIEPRIKAAVLWAGGLPYRGWVKYPALADPINYVSRIDIPILMMNGEYDTTFPDPTSQQPLWDLLGTPPAKRRRVVIPNSGHGLPQNTSLREIADWLDLQRGTPEPGAASD